LINNSIKRFVVNTLTLTAFAGCPITDDLAAALGNHKEKENFSIVLNLVYRAEDAAEKGLYGSPTILFNDLEYQEERRGEAGVYCRSFLTPEGLSSMPDLEDMFAWMGDKEHQVPAPESALNLEYPVLLIDTECVFSRPAKNFWSRIADEAGVDLQVIIAEKERDLASKYSAAGYPCLALSRERKYYGFHFSNQEGKKILTGKVK